MSLKEKLIKLVGKDSFFDDTAVLESYSKDFSLVRSGMPNYVVKPKDAEEIKQILKLANKTLTPVIPVSSKVHFNGAAIPKQGGIIVDLSRFNRILEVDTLNRRVRIEAGVTWGQLATQLDKKGFRVIMPLLPHPDRSIVTDTLEREVPTNIVYDYGEPLQSMEVVWPDGEIFRTGSASVNGYPDSPSKGANPSGPGIDFYRFLQCAQGTFGIVTWANLKIQYKTKIDKVLFAPVYDLENTIDFLYRLLKLRVGQECLLLNNIDLASILAEKWPADFEALRSSLPPWTLILVISGMQRRPEEKIQYEENIIADIIKNEYPDIHLDEGLPGNTGLNKKILPLLRKPWPQGKPYWKNRYKGACQSLFFITKPVMAPKFLDIMREIASLYDYPASDIGAYIQPIEHNRACQVEFNLFYDGTDEYEKERIASFYSNAASVLLEEGALFTRPYGELAALVYDKAAGYTMTLKKLKEVFDPNNIMNPGNLCF
jgi:FAD/FMN-containing dehydrogenase